MEHVEHGEKAWLLDRHFKAGQKMEDEPIRDSRFVIYTFSKTREWSGNRESRMYATDIRFNLGLLSSHHLFFG